MDPQRIALLIVLTLARAAHAAEPAAALNFLEWRADAPFTVTNDGPAGAPVARLTGGAEKRTVTLLSVQRPGISTDSYVVRGRIKYAGVVGEGYLELLNDFGKQGTFFSRSLSESGPTGILTGSSDWRIFALPFSARAGERPERLTLNVVLPGAGTVQVSQPTLEPLRQEIWWDERKAGWIGGLLGTILGLLGSAVGIAAGRQAPLWTLYGLVAVMLLIGAGALLIGLAAALSGQPWHVGYGPLIAGATASMGSVIAAWVITRRTRQDELRRIASLDA